MHHACYEKKIQYLIKVETWDATNRKSQFLRCELNQKNFLTLESSMSWLTLQRDSMYSEEQHIEQDQNPVSLWAGFDIITSTACLEFSVDELEKVLVVSVLAKRSWNVVAPQHSLLQCQSYVEVERRKKGLHITFARPTSDAEGGKICVSSRLQTSQILQRHRGSREIRPYFLGSRNNLRDSRIIIHNNMT